MMRYLVTLLTVLGISIATTSRAEFRQVDLSIFGMD
jgi:hypothetical protein